jgi:hypothetical protein
MSLLRVMTFNLLHIEGPVKQPKNPSEIWENRAELNVQTIRRYDPSIDCLSGVRCSTLEYLPGTLPGIFPAYPQRKR